MTIALDEKLATVPAESPSGIRSHALDTLFEAVEADFGMFFKCVEHDGRWYYTAGEFAGDPSMTERLSRHVDSPVFTSPWTRKYVDSGQIGRFIRIRSYFSTDYLFDFEIQRKVIREIGVTDQLRAVFCDDHRFTGWIGLMRRDIDRQFRPEEQQRVNDALERFQAALLAAESLENDFFRPGPLYAVVRPDGSLERASWRARRWLTEDRIDALGRIVRGYDEGSDDQPSCVVDGAAVHLVRLDGESSVRYLVHVERGALARYDPLEPLTERQREVAEFAAAGATNAEIARTLDVSTSTVKYHLKRIYRSLDIDGRVDLAELV